jgi:hypothetical protein
VRDEEVVEEPLHAAVRVIVVDVVRVVVIVVVRAHALSRPAWCGAFPTTCSACFTASTTSSDACSSVSR